MFGIIGQILLGFIMSLAGELVFALALMAHDWVAHPRKVNVFVAVVGYALFGISAGGLSLFVFPSPYLYDDLPKILNLIFTPVVLGLLIMIVASHELDHHRPYKLRRFLSGYIIALAIALMRFWHFYE